MMNIRHELPPIWDRIIEAGMNPDPRTVAVTMGDTVYIPGGWDMSDDLIEHEKTHTAQQGSDVDGWWEKYLSDKTFRLQQEIEAYRAQYRYICAHVRDRNKRFNYVRAFAQSLSGPMYGNIISIPTAISLITNANGAKK